MPSPAVAEDLRNPRRVKFEVFIDSVFVAIFSLIKMKMSLRNKISGDADRAPQRSKRMGPPEGG
jgi:hypothetical protein